MCRTEIPITKSIREKIALFCNVRPQNVIANMTASNLYEVPLMLEKEGLAVEVCKHLQLENNLPKNEKWEKMIENFKEVDDQFKDDKKKVYIAIVGKYIKLEDSYLSVIESIKHAGYDNNVGVKVKLVDSETINEENVKEKLEKFDGIIVPGGFGNRGIEGKITAIKYARENKIPFLGICLGMQMAVVEFARDVLKLEDVNSEEFEPDCKNPVIHIMETQKNVNKKGGTMRLGAYPCVIKDGSLASELYGKKEISERHRHRFEYNNKYREATEKKGLKISGTSPDGNLVEIVELDKKLHPFFIAGQFHPEFKSRPDRPQPLFVGLIFSAKKQKM